MIIYCCKLIHIAKIYMDCAVPLLMFFLLEYVTILVNHVHFSILGDNGAQDTLKFGEWNNGNRDPWNRGEIQK